MKKKRCPACLITNLFIKNGKGERKLVSVMEDDTIISTKDGETLEGFDTEVIYCLGCSWKGSKKRLVSK